MLEGDKRMGEAETLYAQAAGCGPWDAMEALDVAVAQRTRRIGWVGPRVCMSLLGDAIVVQARAKRFNAPSIASPDRKSRTMKYLLIAWSPPPTAAQGCRHQQGRAGRVARAECARAIRNQHTARGTASNEFQFVYAHGRTKVKPNQASCCPAPSCSTPPVDTKADPVKGDVRLPDRCRSADAEEIQAEQALTTSKPAVLSLWPLCGAAFR